MKKYEENHRENKKRAHIDIIIIHRNIKNTRE